VNDKPLPAPQYASPTHQALAELAALLNALPTEKTIVVQQSTQQSLAAQLRAVIANQSQTQGSP